MKCSGWFPGTAIKEKAGLQLCNPAFLSLTFIR
jgi:hypothetical protein